MQQFDLEVETSGELIKKEGESYLAIRSSAGKRSFLSLAARRSGLSAGTSGPPRARGLHARRRRRRGR